ncbi:MAG TPA: STAS domain-containing protein [Isosphaeraceae bacterium]|nr:STAS domain-containing protein [Isosphaeraceae bacterium]
MTESTRRLLRLEEFEGVLVVSFLESKIVTEENIQDMGDELYALVEQDGQNRLLLDFENVHYLSSAALGRLINLKKKVTAANGRLRIFGVHPDIMEVLRITHLDTVFDIQPDRETALQGMSE